MKKKRVKAGTSRAEADRKRGLFVESYITNGGNATQAAKSAGYSEKSADQAGSRLLKDVKVRALLDARHKEIANRYKLTTERVTQELSRLCYSDVRQLFKADGSLKGMHELDDATAAALAGVDVVEMAGGMGAESGAIGHVPMYTKKVKLWDKNAALEKAMKHLGLFEKDNEQAGAVARLIYAPQKRAG